MNALIKMNADVHTTGTVYADGPVIVQGVDIKAEIERLGRELVSLDEKCAARADEVFYFVLQRFQLKEGERTVISEILDHMKSITDSAARLQFVASTLHQLNPITAIAIAVLLKGIQYMTLKVERE